jgi:hypothetical protein
MKFMLILILLNYGCLKNEGSITVNNYHTSGTEDSNNSSGNINDPDDISNSSDSTQTDTSQNDSTQNDPTDESTSEPVNSGLTASDCPPLFVPVPGNAGLGVSDFCVMKYEARDDGSSNAILDQSSLSSQPWGNITGNQAFAKCAAFSANGFAGEFALISNPEWMTIARNLELKDDNWSSGTAGTGKLYKGHTDSSPNSSIAASADDTQGYHLTGNSSSQALGSGLEQKRTMVLSNDYIIWDFAGNLAEWVDWDASNSSYDIGPNDTGNAFREINVLTGSMTADDVQSSFGYDSSQNAGKWYGATSSQGSTYRGGFYFSLQSAGIFSLSSNLSANDTRAQNGFRCVYRP